MRVLGSYVRHASTLIVHRPRGWKAVLYNTSMAKARRVGPLMMPAHVSIEPTNVCNARCPVCETGNGSMERKGGFLDFDEFVALMDQIAPTTGVLMFYFMGEPFLNPRAYEMIRYARAKGIFVETCTNGDFVNAEGILYSDVNQISFQVGGMDETTHGIYRVRSQFTRVEKNLRELIQLRRKCPDSSTSIEVGFIVMKHNEHQVNQFLLWAEEIGVDKASVIDPCVRDLDEGRRFLTDDPKYWFYDQESFKQGVLRPKTIPENECTWIWNSTMINWNGDVVPCCRDPHGRHVFGNAFSQSLKEIWNGAESRQFRKQIIQNQSSVDICRLCSGYGVPRLHRPREVDFVVERHTVNDPEIRDTWLQTGNPIEVQLRHREQSAD